MSQLLVDDHVPTEPRSFDLNQGFSARGSISFTSVQLKKYHAPPSGQWRDGRGAGGRG